MRDAPRSPENLILLTDSYKVTHWKQYPPGSEVVYSYFESRGGRFHDIVFFGLQYYLKRYLAGARVTQDDIDEAEAFFTSHFGRRDVFCREGWEHIVREHGGRLPVSIRAVPEGTIVPQRNVLMTIQNTDPRCCWLANYLETLLVQAWYTTTVATQSREMKHLLLKYLHQTGDPSGVDFMLHDFGFRGVSSVETAGIGACAHLVQFKGTDTLEGCRTASRYYGEPMAGFSIPASEHSTMTAWGREREGDAMANMLRQFPDGMMACVSDSFDIYAACRDIWGDRLRDEVLARDGTLVIRPDSGDPPRVICELLPILYERLGGHENAKGYRVLDRHVRLIQGDAVDFDMLDQILYAMKHEGYAAENIAFGSGGALLQKLNRDTLKFAFKCSAIRIDGKWNDVYKSPVTDRGKRSKRGRLKLVRETIPGERSKLVTVGPDDPREDLLVEVFRDGKLLVDHTLAEIRERAKATGRGTN